MSNLDWSGVKTPKKKPTRKQVALYRQWIKYLSDSRLDIKTIYERAQDFAERGEKVPKE